MFVHGEGEGVQGRQAVAAPDARALQQGRGNKRGHQLGLSITMPEAHGKILEVILFLISR